VLCIGDGLGFDSFYFAQKARMSLIMKSRDFSSFREANCFFPPEKL